MKKLKAELPIKRWGGLVTKYPAASAMVSPDEFTSGSKNFDTNVRGIVSKRLGGVAFGSGSTALTDQFEAIFVDGTRHLLVMDSGTLKYTAGDGILTTVKSGYTAAARTEFALYQDRVYFCNGVSAAQVYDRTATYGGAYALPVTLTVVDYTGLGSDTVKIGATTLTEAVEWTAATSNEATATSLASAIDALSGVSASAVGTVITVTSETPSVVVLSDAVNLTIASISAPRVRDAGATAPSSALTAATGAAGNVPAGTYTYKVTFLYYDAAESNGGTVSASVSPGSSLQINLTAIPIGGYGVTARKIYRDDGTSGYRLVATVENNTDTTATDNSAVGTAFIPEDNGTPPQFKYVSQHLDRLAFGGVSGNTSDLFFTEAGIPDVMLSTGYVTCDPESPITGIVVFQDRWLVLNRSSFGQILGETSDTFRYAPIPGSVGCVDNRTIQVRTINGVPTVVWLSDKGFYMYNGTTVDYISDAIEDLVNLNLQQADFSSGAHTDSSASDFAAGTASQAIDLAAIPGSITVPDPTETYDTQTAWETGTDLNLVTKATAMQSAARIGTPLGKTFDYVMDASPESANVEGDATELTLAAASSSSGETISDSGTASAVVSNLTDNFNIRRIATRITVGDRGGTITGVSFPLIVDGAAISSPTSVNCRYRLRADTVGTVGAVVGGSAYDVASTVIVPAAGDQAVTYTSPTLSWAVAPNTSYWIEIVTQDYSGPISLGNLRNFKLTAGAWSGASPTQCATYGGNFSTAVRVFTSSPALGYMAGSYTFTQAGQAASGTWVSEATNVGFLSDASAQTIYLNNIAGTYPSGCTSTTYVDTSDDEAFGSGVATASVSNLNGASTTTLARKQWFRVRVQLDTTDDRNVPVYGALSLGFGAQSTWTSPGIDCTTDATALNTLTVVASLPDGTSATYSLQSSSDDGATDAYAELKTGSLADGTNSVSLSGLTPEKYQRVVFTLNSDANTATAVAQISRAVLTWTTVSTFESAEIDVGTTPAGWDIFNTETTLDGGTVTYALKSAASSGALAAATYYAVATGAFPSASTLPLRYAKWKATITATSAHTPVIASATVAWFTSSAAATIRAASLFYNKTYYVALAEAEETANNIVLVFDENKRWYRYEGVSISTMGKYHNRPLVCLADTPTMVRWLWGQTDQGTNIALQVVTKALDFDDSSKTKILRSITVLTANTGATWTYTYSVDGGTTWYALVDYTGNASFTTGTDGNTQPHTLVPQWPNQIAGRTIMVKGVSSDENDAQLYELKVSAFMRESERVDA